MTADTITIHGTLQADGVTLQLEKKVALPPGRVTVTVRAEQPVPAGSELTMVEVLDRIHRDQLTRGRKPMTEEQMVAEIADLRADDDAYEERCRQLWSQTSAPSRDDE